MTHALKAQLSLCLFLILTLYHAEQLDTSIHRAGRPALQCPAMHMQCYVPFAVDIIDFIVLCWKAFYYYLLSLLLRTLPYLDYMRFHVPCASGYAHPCTPDRCCCCDVGRDQQKGEALGALFTRINKSLESTGSFPPSSGEQGSEAQPQAQGQAHVWTMFQLAQHYDMQGRTGGWLTPKILAPFSFPYLAQPLPKNCWGCWWW